MTTMKTVIAWLGTPMLLFMSTFVFAADQGPANVPDADVTFLSTLPHAWQSQAPTFSLMPTMDKNRHGNGRPGQVWIRKIPEGLLIAGHVDGSPPDFPETADGLLARDHVEIWLAQQPYPKFPTLGWGHQFGDVELPDGGASCEKALYAYNQQENAVKECKKWAREQPHFRTQLRRLFARKWLLAPGISVESYATPAYAVASKFKLDESKDNRVLETLRPEGAPKLTVTTNPAGGYEFETMIPWQMFPPANSAKLRDLYLEVDVFSSATAGTPHVAYSSSSSRRVHANFSSFSRIRLERPKEYAISPCHYPVVGLGFNEDAVPGYFMPMADEVIAKTLILENLRAGYQYTPFGASPHPAVTEFFGKQLQNGDYVCGPLLRIYHDDKGVDVPAIVQHDSFDVLELPGGILVRGGPKTTTLSPYGAGQCGSCSMAELTIYAITKNLSVRTALDIREDDEDPVNTHINVAKDWSRVGVYVQNSFNKDTQTYNPNAPWHDRFYCRQGMAYHRCGTAKTPPPAH
jgi:hypothetical protein